MTVLKRKQRVILFTMYVCIGTIISENINYAQTYLPDQIITDKILNDQNNKKDIKKWELKGELSSNFSFTNNKNYVGQSDGSIYQLNIITEEDLNWREGQHEVLNNLKIKYGLSKTPQLEDLFKSQDQFKYMGTYLYRLENIPWFGPFGRLNFSTSLFSGYFVSPNDEILKLNFADGTYKLTDTLEANNRCRIVDSFEPMRIRGNVGFFANPYDQNEFKLNMKLGVGYQKIAAKDGFVLADDADTDYIELKQLEDSDEAGLEFEMDVAGVIQNNMNWSFVANLFYPLNDSQSDDEIEGFEMLNTEIEGKFSTKITKNMSLDYFLIIKRLPLIIEDWQIQNGVVLNISYNLF